jgi:hypothetical protein
VKALLQQVSDALKRRAMATLFPQHTGRETRGGIFCRQENNEKRVEQPQFEWQFNRATPKPVTRTVELALSRISVSKISPLRRRDSSLV